MDVWEDVKMKSSKYLLNLVLRKGNCLFNLDKFLKNDNGENYMQVSNLVVKNIDLNKEIEPYYFPNNFSDITYPMYLKGLSLYKILLWYCCQLKTYSSKINDFTKYKESFEQYVLTKKYEKAIDILVEVEEKFGMSLWLIESYCIIEEFFENQPEFVNKLDDIARSFYYHFKGKSNTKEPSFLYLKRVSKNLSEAEVYKELHTYYSYKLFLSTAKTDEEWKEILIVEGMNSLIDIYITVVNCLQYYFSNSVSEKTKVLFLTCYNILKDLQSPTCKMMYNYLMNIEQDVIINDYLNDFLKAFKNNEYKKVVELFFSNDSNLYQTFTAYRFVATSLLALNEEPEKTSGLLINEIVQLIFDILRKDEIENLKESIERLSVLARTIHSFSIHKGICVFLQIVENTNRYYSDNEQYNTQDDINLIHYEINCNNKVLLPFECMYNEKSYEQLDEHIYTIEKTLEVYSKENYIYNYYKEAYYRLRILKNIRLEKYTDAASLLIESHMESMFLIYTMNTDAICRNICSKIEESIPLVLEELSFVFFDDDFKRYRIDCFLNFLDDNNFIEPLDITKSKYPSKLVYYFLYTICNKKTLSKIYWLFDSSEEVDEYRVKICNYLLDFEPYNKELKSEIEDLTKNLALKKRLRDVDKSRVFVDIRDIYKKIYSAIDRQVEIFNSIPPSRYVKGEDKENVIYCRNPRHYILAEMYSIYAKEFCFSSSGIDTSLSTRVRHGSLSNQVLRTLSDNALTYNKYSSNNKLFDESEQNDDIFKAINMCLLDFNINVNQKLEYLRQHILKVFIDKPIDEAVFDYSYSIADRDYLLELFEYIEKTNTEQVISVLNNILITKTNHFLVTIKDEVLPDLLNSLIDECDKLNETISPYIEKKTDRRRIGKKIADCKAALYSEIDTISEWFSLNDSDNWDDFSFDDLIDMCFEIEKKLFSGFESINLNRFKENDFVFKGEIFRQCIDIILMLFNNAIQHSGFIGQLSELKIDCSIKSDNNSIYLIVENNISDTINKEDLNSIIIDINNNYKGQKYLMINTREEGGMGLLKVMAILFSATHAHEQFYVSLNENKFRVEIKIKKEIVLDDKNLNS